MAPDQRRVLACGHYPGGWMTMGWFGFYGGGKALGLFRRTARSRRPA